MANLKFSDALEQIEGGKLGQTYLILGDQYYQRFLLTEKIVQKTLPQTQRVYNKQEVAGNRATVAKLQEYLAGVPLFGGNTVVVVTDLEKIPKTSQEYLLKALKSLDSSVTFVGAAKKLDGRTAFAKGLISTCQPIELKEIYPNLLPSYVRSRFQVRKLAVEAEAIDEFCRLVGNDCGDIENEVEKLSIIYSGTGRLGIKEIREYLSSSRYYSQYDVARQLTSKKLRESLVATRNYIDSSASEGGRGLFWALYNEYERLLACQKLGTKMSPADLAGKLRLHPFLLKELQSQASHHKPEEMAKALIAIYQAEVDDRFIASGAQQNFERMILKILVPKRE
jgi:DNA polymerase III delta subunit